MKNSAVILLAAGASRRLGQPKQLVVFEGKTLLRRAAEAACLACERVFVVLGAAGNLMLPELEDLPVRVLQNEDWAEGLASSIRLGLAAAKREVPDLQAVVLSVCDQPRLSGEVFEEIFRDKLRSGNGLVACRYAGAVGVPALFEAKYFPELVGLTGDAGAKKLLLAHADDLGVVDWPEGTWDVDFPADLPN